MSSASENQKSNSAAVKEEAPPTKKITLKTADDKYFNVEESIAMEFTAVKNFFDDEGTFSKETVVPLPNVSAKSLSQIIEYCGKQMELRAKEGNEKAKKEYDEKFVSEISNEDLKELILAVNYLEIKYLLEVLNKAAAKRIEGKSVAFVRKFLGIECDFTPEEEERIRNENAWAFEGVDDDDEDN